MLEDPESEGLWHVMVWTNEPILHETVTSPKQARLVRESLQKQGRTTWVVRCHMGEQCIHVKEGRNPSGISVE